MSVVRSVRAAADHLRAGDGGTIVNITSRSVREAIDDLVLSNAVRRAVGLMKTRLRVCAEVRVNAVIPGAHGHHVSRNSSKQPSSVASPTPEEGFKSWAVAPLQRVGRPEELGDVVAFLSSPRPHTSLDGPARRRRGDAELQFRPPGRSEPPVVAQFPDHLSDPLGLLFRDHERPVVE